MENIISATQLNLSIGQRVYFEDEHGNGYGIIHYLPNEKEIEFFVKCDSVASISIMPNRSKRARFIPINQIVIKE